MLPLGPLGSLGALANPETLNPKTPTNKPLNRKTLNPNRQALRPKP